MLRAESVRTAEASNATLLLSTVELDELLRGTSEDLRGDLLKAATVQLSRYVGYAISRKRITAGYPRWSKAMELPAPRPQLPYTDSIVSDISLFEVTAGTATPVTAEYFTDYDPPPPRVTFTGAVPMRTQFKGDALPARIEFTYSPLNVKDNRTVLLKRALTLLIQTLVDQQDDPTAPETAWRQVAAPLRRLPV